MDISIQTIITGSSATLLSATVIYAAKKIAKVVSDSKKDCEWHRRNTASQMFAMDAVLDFIEREARDRNFQLNGRFARARKHVDDYIEESERGV